MMPFASCYAGFSQQRMCPGALHPAFRIRHPAIRSCPADGFPNYVKTIAHIYNCIPGLGIRFSLRRYRATSVASYIATRLHAYRTTRRRPAERPEGRPWAPSGHAPIFKRGAVGAPRSASTGYRLINTNLTSRTNDKEAKLNRSRTETSKTLVFQSRTQPSTANKKNSSPIHSVTEEINFA